MVYSHVPHALTFYEWLQHVLLADQLKPVPAQQSRQSVRDYVTARDDINKTLICIYIYQHTIIYFIT